MKSDIFGLLIHVGRGTEPKKTSLMAGDLLTFDLHESVLKLSRPNNGGGETPIYFSIGNRDNKLPCGVRRRGEESTLRDLIEALTGLRVEPFKTDPKSPHADRYLRYQLVAPR
jgi:hypothetical protein